MTLSHSVMTAVAKLTFVDEEVEVLLRLVAVVIKTRSAKVIVVVSSSQSESIFSWEFERIGQNLELFDGGVRLVTNIFKFGAIVGLQSQRKEGWQAKEKLLGDQEKYTSYYYSNHYRYIPTAFGVAANNLWLQQLFPRWNSHAFLGPRVS
uniref:Uncharacterized protein n=1 Tax=Ditylenchus dipsaci TaxID=166011 RepID=A0A915D2B6_9BILA